MLAIVSWSGFVGPILHDCGTRLHMRFNPTRFLCRFDSTLPSGKLTWLLKIVIYSWFAHFKRWFSIAMLNYQRVHPILPIYSNVASSCSMLKLPFLMTVVNVQTHLTPAFLDPSHRVSDAKRPNTAIAEMGLSPSSLGFSQANVLSN